MPIILSDPASDTEWMDLSRSFIESASRLLNEGALIHSTYFACYSIEAALKSARSKSGLNKELSHSLERLLAGLEDIPRAIFVGKSARIFDFGKEKGGNFINDFTMIRYQHNIGVFGVFDHGEFLADCIKVVDSIDLRLSARARRRARQ